MTATLAPPTCEGPMKVLFTREDCDKFEETKVLDFKYELIEGVIYRMGQNYPHGICVMRVINWLIVNFGLEMAMTQTSIDVRPEDNPTNAPIPDGILLRNSFEDLREMAKPTDIAMLIEVSDSTLAFDLGLKANLYARSEIPEYWVIDLNDRAIYVHRSPVNGKYESVNLVREPGKVSPLSKPEISTLVSEFMPLEKL